MSLSFHNEMLMTSKPISAQPRSHLHLYRASRADFRDQKSIGKKSLTKLLHIISCVWNTYPVSVLSQHHLTALWPEQVVQWNRNRKWCSRNGPYKLWSCSTEAGGNALFKEHCRKHARSAKSAQFIACQKVESESLTALFSMLRNFFSSLLRATSFISSNVL